MGDVGTDIGTFISPLAGGEFKTIARGGRDDLIVPFESGATS